MSIIHFNKKVPDAKIRTASLVTSILDIRHNCGIMRYILWYAQFKRNNNNK